MIRFEYDPPSAGVKISFILRDGEMSQTTGLDAFDYEPPKRDGKRRAKSTPANLRVLVGMIEKLIGHKEAN